MPFLLLLFGCDRSSPDLVLYTSVDEPVARPVIEEFQRRTGLKVLIKTDTEATKSVGLAERLEAEKANPQADVWWGNEVFHTINLADRGILAAYDSPSAAAIPALYKDPEHRWAGTALRARVIAINTADGASATAQVRSILDLTSPALKGKIVMASPSAGTTGGHMAALYTLWGPEKADAWFRALKANGIKLVGGNSIVAETVGQGVKWAGLTDNDDVEAMAAHKAPIAPVLPDQGPDQIGTLTFPCTAGLVAGSKRAENARKLIDYLLSKEVEAKLIEAKFARYSVFAPPGAGGVKAMDVDYRKVAGNLKEASEAARRAME